MVVERSSRIAIGMQYGPAMDEHDNNWVGVPCVVTDDGHRFSIAIANLGRPTSGQRNDAR